MPLSEALPGLRIHPFEDGAVPLGAYMLVKLLDGDGDPTWSFRTTERPNKEELLGALMVQVDLLRRSLADEWDVV